MLKEIKSLIAFLTIIPVGMDPDCLIDAANYMYLFPLVGAFIGLLAGAFARLLLNVLAASVVGISTLGFILLVTGLHHIDGLFDFGDGIMYQGPPERKIGIMHDPKTGSGGIALGIVTILTTALCIAQLDNNIIIESLVLSEVSAKLSMVIMARFGRSAHKGMNTYFINAMQGKYRNLRLITALIISFGIAIPLLWITGSAVMVVGIFSGLIMIEISNRHFRGVTGDVMGATNELARMVSLVMILVTMPWV